MNIWRLDNEFQSSALGCVITRVSGMIHCLLKERNPAS
jgi:hypothetical protein